MFDLSQFKYGFVIVAVLSILSGLKLLLSHFLPADNAVGKVVGKIVDFLSANVQH